MASSLVESGKPKLNEELQQFLTFSLNGLEFGVPILQIQEIKNYSRVTPIPNTPENVCGVINLRGTVIPIVDLRGTLGMPPATYDRFTVIIVVNVDNKIEGLVVDSVSDVLDVKACDIEIPPALSNQQGGGVVRGIAKSDDRLVSLLDLHMIISTVTPRLPN